ncbi:hypothetical protein HaLaN_31016 [Haematococcus lacustris]|uniref:Uncharacterized protein n=1 Tax=Haematococcus lacustris TaxID=44745 RepID=A0A6A0AHV6_HAELA|nr:hypothetical protein HaLaN_31016 [Haematococcus lacustris]
MQSQPEREQRERMQSQHEREQVRLEQAAIRRKVDQLEDELKLLPAGHPERVLLRQQLIATQQQLPELLKKENLLLETSRGAAAVDALVTAFERVLAPAKEEIVGAICDMRAPVRIAASSANTTQVQIVTTYCKINAIAEPKSFRCCFNACEDASPHLLDGLESMVWQGRSEPYRDNMKNAAKVWSSWLGDPGVLVVAVDGAPWLEVSVAAFQMTGSKTDLIALDLDLLHHLDVLEDGQLQALKNGTASGDLVQTVVHAVVMAFELKHPQRIKGSAWNVRHQCTTEFVGINLMNGTCDQRTRAWAAGEVSLWGGALCLHDTIGLHTVAGADGRRDLHITQFTRRHKPVLIAAMRHMLKRAKDERRIIMRYAPDDTEGTIHNDTTATNNHNSSGGRQGNASTSGDEDASSGAASNAQPPAQPALSATERWVAACSSPSGSPQACDDSISNSDSDGASLASITEALNVPEDYHERAAFNASWQHAMREAVNQPSMLRHLTGQDTPVPQSAFADKDAYGWAVRLAQTVVCQLEADGRLKHGRTCASG